MCVQREQFLFRHSVPQTTTNINTSEENNRKIKLQFIADVLVGLFIVLICQLWITYLLYLLYSN